MNKLNLDDLKNLVNPGAFRIGINFESEEGKGMVKQEVTLVGNRGALMAAFTLMMAQSNDFYKLMAECVHVYTMHKDDIDKMTQPLRDATEVISNESNSNTSDTSMSTLAKMVEALKARKKKGVSN